MGDLIGTPARSRRHSLQYRLDHRAPRPAQEIRGAFRRHRAGDQAGLRRSITRRVSVLGTEATVAARIYPCADPRLRRDCKVTLVGSKKLAAYAEGELAGAQIDDACRRGRDRAVPFVDDGNRTDTVVLACTHYPLLIDRLRRLAPWPVNFSIRRRRSRGASSICSVPPHRRRDTGRRAPFSLPAGRRRRCWCASAFARPTGTASLPNRRSALPSNFGWVRLVAASRRQYAFSSMPGSTP